MPTFDSLLAQGAPPLLAILRGLRSDEAPEVGAALVDAGVRIIEVPLNSPDPFASVALSQRTFGDKALIGAGRCSTWVRSNDWRAPAPG
jgi:2-dehydro-3-deoxyphosphogalactonate aldolase